ncbi:MAG: DUF1275 domain-containing protein [Magnetospirillum sp.]|nr:DUF1275 domain-containing protein [Magnetospirillum sp.]
MPVFFLRKLTGDHRTCEGNRRLGLSLAFVAGAMNAGGFMAVDQYTSHMTGVVSSIADALAIHSLTAVLTGIGSVASFVAGAAYSAILINWGRHHRTHSRYAYPLLWEAALLLVFGLMGGTLELKSGFVPITVMLLCFLMGLQNAIITKISNAEIRTTHMTGIITDIGIELGKAVYVNSQQASPHYQPVHANLRRLALLLGLLSAFFVGGIAGALGFKYVGYASTLPLAGLLTVLAMVPLVDDVRTRTRLLLHYRRRG